MPDTNHSVHLMMKMMDDLAYSTLWDIAPRLRSRQVSAVELTRACLRRIREFEPRINAFITLREHAALEEAAWLDGELARGADRGPLHGIPLVHKDLFNTAGLRTTAGSKVLADFVPDTDATVVRRLSEAGVVLLGKANMQEFAMGGSNNNPHYGATHNPWHLDCIPGGSSGGSAAALAAGFCLAATGSDTAGSIRHPAHMCGVSGIKPTYGAVSCHGVVPLTWSLDHVGPMARSIRDVALLLKAMAGYDWQDSASVDRELPDVMQGIDDGIAGLRVGVPPERVLDSVQSAVAEAFTEALATFRRLGATCVEVEFPPRTTSVNTRAETLLFHRDWLEQRPADYGDEIRPNLVQALEAHLSALDYVQSLRDRAALVVEMRSLFQTIDVLITPTAPVTATPIGVWEVEMHGERVPLRNCWTTFTSPFNHCGFPATSQPCGFDAQGLPIGLQVVGRAWDDATVLRAANAFEQATAWHRRRPDLREHPWDYNC
jgi:aspartyl-tRNA(Asn)/glutamyl-tRNA(Gln) amidotransferase subunit A